MYACLFQPLPYRCTKLIRIKNEFAKGKYGHGTGQSPAYLITLIKNSPKLTRSRAVTQKAQPGGSQPRVGLALSPLQPPTPRSDLPEALGQPGTPRRQCRQSPSPRCARSPPASPPSWGLTSERDAVPLCESDTKQGGKELPASALFLGRASFEARRSSPL